MIYTRSDQIPRTKYVLYAASSITAGSKSLEPKFKGLKEEARLNMSNDTK